MEYFIGYLRKNHSTYGELISQNKFPISGIYVTSGGKRTANEWPQKCDGGLYNGADGVHCPFIYIYNGKTSIYKKESGCIPPRLGDTLSDSRFDFKNLTQSEAREPPTSGCTSMMEGPTMVLIVSIGLQYTYT